MLPSLNQTTSRAARRTWLFLGVAGVLAVVLPTAHTVTRPRIAGAAGILAVAADLPENRAADPVAQRGGEPSERSKKTDAGGMVEFLPRPTKEESALDEPLDFEVVEMPFEDCVKLFARQAKINVALDNQALQDDGVALDQPVTLTVKGGRAGSVLNRLLQLVKDEKKVDQTELAFVFEEDHLKITTAARAGERLITRWYPVWDLHPGAADAHVESSELPQPAGRLTAPPHGGGGGGFGGGPQPQRVGRFTAPPHIAELIQVLITTVQPDSWEELSGPGCVAYSKEIQCLLIRQTSEAHREILQLLRLWREAKRLERAAVAGIAADAVALQGPPRLRQRKGNPQISRISTDQIIRRLESASICVICGSTCSSFVPERIGNIGPKKTQQEQMEKTETEHEISVSSVISC